MYAKAVAVALIHLGHGEALMYCGLHCVDGLDHLCSGQTAYQAARNIACTGEVLDVRQPSLSDWYAEARRRTASRSILDGLVP